MFAVVQLSDHPPRVIVCPREVPRKRKKQPHRQHRHEHHRGDERGDPDQVRGKGVSPPEVAVPLQLEKRGDRQGIPAATPKHTAVMDACGSNLRDTHPTTEDDTASATRTTSRMAANVYVLLWKTSANSLTYNTCAPSTPKPDTAAATSHRGSSLDDADNGTSGTPRGRSKRVLRAHATAPTVADTAAAAQLVVTTPTGASTEVLSATPSTAPARLNA